MQGAGRGRLPAPTGSPAPRRPPGPASALRGANRFHLRPCARGCWGDASSGVPAPTVSADPAARLQKLLVPLGHPSAEAHRRHAQALPLLPPAAVTGTRRSRSRRGCPATVSLGSSSLVFMSTGPWMGQTVPEGADPGVVRRLSEFPASASGSHRYRALRPGRDPSGASGRRRPVPGGAAPAGLGRGRAHVPGVRLRCVDQGARAVSPDTATRLATVPRAPCHAVRVRALRKARSVVAINETPFLRNKYRRKSFGEEARASSAGACVPGVCARRRRDGRAPAPRLLHEHVHADLPTASLAPGRTSVAWTLGQRWSAGASRGCAFRPLCLSQRSAGKWTRAVSVPGTPALRPRTGFHVEGVRRMPNQRRRR